MMKIFMVVLITMLSACSSQEYADTIYLNGSIITMDDNMPFVQAMAVKKGKILALGSEETIRQYQGKSTKIKDLEGNTLLPGFVDAHGHTFAVGMHSVSANLYPAPDGEANSLDDILKILQEYYATNPPLFQDIGWLVGFGYDESQLKEQKHPTKFDLDKVFPDIPVYIVHQSGHLGVANSKGLELLGITAETPDPEGGVIRRVGNTQEPDGVLEETAHIQSLVSAGDFSPLFAIKMFLSGVDTMASQGFTTAHEGRSSDQQVFLMKILGWLRQLPIDIVAYPDVLHISKSLKDIGKDYVGRFRVGGIKLGLDGSPQGKTAWRDRPYVVPPHGYNADYKGYPAMEKSLALEKIEMAYASNWQIITHANGEAAIDLLIEGVEKAQQKYGTNNDLRPVLIHGQFLRKDQVKKIKELNIFPSVFPVHTFYWGDWHAEQTIGIPGVYDISPTKWIEDEGMMFTIHHDAPIVPPDNMKSIWSAVNRISRSGKVIGEDQRISVMTALKSVTLWSAYQHFEEDKKGSLEQGKLADFVILSENPLEIDPIMITNIKILETIKENKTVYKRI